MRVALFVEGSIGVADRAGIDIFTDLWRTTLVASLGLRSIDFVFPISKKHVIALNPERPKMSGASEPLDYYIVRKLESHSFDVALVAWDLQPAWEGASDGACRWRETLEFYRLLSASAVLPAPWLEQARSRFTDLSGRSSPGDRARPARLRLHGIFAICMEPVFEALLLGSEGGVKRALGVDGMRVPGWPNWDVTQPRPEITVLQKAIISARSVVPRRRAAHVVVGDMRTAKHEWARRLVSQLSEDAAAHDVLVDQPLARRLVELLPRDAPRRRRR